MLDLSKCRGVWCPQRRIPGLLIAHAWSPHTSNRITCDHIFFYFTIPKAEGFFGWAADIFSLMHESSIFRSVIQPCMWFLHDRTG